MKKIRELFRNTKLNIKFTSIIILFMVIPIGVLAGVLFYVMEQNAVQENMDYMEYTMQRNEDGIKTKIDSINMSTQFFLSDDCNGVQREHNKKLNNGLPILRKVPPKRDYGRYFCIMAEKGGTSHGGLTEKLSPFFHAKKQEVNAYGR